MRTPNSFGRPVDIVPQMFHDVILVHWADMTTNTLGLCISLQPDNRTSCPDSHQTTEVVHHFDHTCLWTQIGGVAVNLGQLHLHTSLCVLMVGFREEGSWGPSHPPSLTFTELHFPCRCCRLRSPESKKEVVKLWVDCPPPPMLGWNHVGLAPPPILHTDCLEIETRGAGANLSFSATPPQRSDPCE